MMTVEQIAQTAGISLLSATRGLANLIEKGLIVPETGNPEEVVAELRQRVRAIAADRLRCS